MNLTPRRLRRTGRRLLVVLAACGLAAGCRQGLSHDEFDLLVTWLTCDDCLGQERQGVAAMGDRVVPFLVEAFDSLPGGRREVQRQRYRQQYATLSSPTRSETEFVDHYLQALDETVRTRVALSLGDLEAWDELADLRDRAAARGYGAPVADLLTAMTLSEPGALTVGTGSATLWRMVEPQGESVLCNGTGGTPCPGAHTVGVSATATMPTASGGAPFRLVAFYVRPSGGASAPALLAVAGAPSVVDNGVERMWTWAAYLDATGLAPGPLEVFAAGVDSAGQAFGTPPNTEITVVPGA